MVKWKKRDDWFWEGNVQQVIGNYLERQGYMIRTADTLSKAAGSDILATKSGKNLLIEVKGWPSEKYVSGDKQGQMKRTRPTTQSKHWFGSAILTLMRRKNNYPDYELALGLPDNKKYRNLLNDVRASLIALGFSVFFVSESGKVEKAL